MMALSEGVLRTIMNGGSVDAPVLQILGISKLCGDSETARYQVLVSDGLYTFKYTMLAPQLNVKISNGDLDEFSVVRISRFTPSLVQYKEGNLRRILIFLDIDVVLPGASVGQLIGNPKPLIKEPSSLQRVNPAPVVKRSTSLLHTSTSSLRTPISPGSRRDTGKADVSVTNLTTSTPCELISSLTPLSSKWVIKARVTKKMVIRTWTNIIKEGKLFSFDILDNSGEIRVTAFNKLCDKFYNLIEVGKVFMISQGVVKLANKRFNTLNNDHEITLNSSTQIIPVLEDTSEIPTVSFNFSPLSEVENMDAETSIDVLGVCRSVAKLISFSSSKKEIKKRDVVLADRSMVSVAFTLWGQEAEEFKGEGHPVVAVKRGRVHVFEGAKSVSTSSCSSFFINPDIPQAHQLKEWYDNEGHALQYKNISEPDGNLTLLEDFVSLAANAEGIKLYYTCKCTIVAMKHARAIYSACPGKNCFKKVVELNNGLYRCENCKKEYPDCRHRLLLQMYVVDWASSQWFMCFSENAEEILGRSALELGELKEKDTNAYQRVFENANYTTKLFRIRAEWKASENEEGAEHLNFTVLSAKPLDYAAHSRHLLEELKKLYS